MDENNKVYIISDNVINSLGFTTEEVFSELKNGTSGIRLNDDKSITHSHVPLSKVNSDQLDHKFSSLSEKYTGVGKYTRLEKMFILSIEEAVNKTGNDFSQEDTLLIISTTKGNIDLLEQEKKKDFPSDRIFLWKMAEEIGNFFGFKNRPLVVSNACISGVIALGTGFRYLKAGLYKNIIVSGGDITSEFVVSGFLSFQALSAEACMPFDLNRTGLTIGEGCGTIILSSEPDEIHPAITITGTAITNDANHISGPSRTGDELALAIQISMAESGIDARRIDFISAHGTATVYNDEMESKAITTAGLQKVPVNSFKGYWGHTLGAAGIIESVMTIKSMKENILIKSIGFSETGTPHELNILEENLSKSVSNCLKIASGFGGCNAAIIFHKD